MQRAWQDSPKYKDTEFVVYHYPQRYFDQLSGGEKFVYYRPSRGSTADESSTYFGCGELGEFWEDPNDSGHRFVAIRKPIRFNNPVPYHDSTDRMFESFFTSPNNFQGRSVRYIADLDYYRILNAAGLTGQMVDSAPTVDDVLTGRVSALISTPPTDAFRELITVPEGTGYRPAGNVPDVYAAAQLQERARADHQGMVRLIKKQVDARGGKCLFNNHVDVLALFGNQKFLVEVKSLNPNFSCRPDALWDGTTFRLFRPVSR